MALNVVLLFPESPDLGAGLKVRRYELRDAMGELFELTVELLSADPAVAESDVVGLPVVVEFGDEPILKQVSGIVWEMKQTTAVLGGDSRYLLTIAPPLRLTTERHDHRIFQNKSVPAIVDEVLSGYAGRIEVPVKYGTDDAEAWEYCVQYRETDWQFLRRILGDGGFATFFDHENESRWVLIDNTTTDLTSDRPPIQFLDQTHLKPIDDGTPYILTMAWQRAIRTSRVSLRDYNYENPGAKAEGTQSMEPENTVESEPDLEHYEFNVDYFSEEGAGDSYAKVRLQGIRTGARLVTCTANFTLSPGSRITVEGHPNLDGDYLVVRAHAVVDDGGERRHELVLMDAEQPWMPPVQKQPRIHGIQTAVVVGAEGTEIDVDKLGRVLLAFRWDRRNPTSGAPTRRVRVSQGWSGTDRGFVALPRVGDEVLVAYLDGDPANPIVVGRVHNAASTSPLNLPAEAAISLWRGKSTPGGGGFNEIRMDDRAGAEQLALRAQQDMATVVLRDQATNIGRHANTTVAGNHGHNVAGHSSTVVAKSSNLKAKKITIDAETQVAIGAGEDVKVIAGNRIALATSGASIELDGDHVDIKAAEIRIEATAGVHISSGSARVVLHEGVLYLHGKPVRINC